MLAPAHKLSPDTTPPAQPTQLELITSGQVLLLLLLLILPLLVVAVVFITGILFVIISTWPKQARPYGRDPGRVTGYLWRKAAAQSCSMSPHLQYSQ